jgi:creatinine amidohydrolase
MASRKATAELGIACAAVNTSGLIGKKLQELRVSEPGGMAHACEMETSYYLYLDSSSVQMEKAVKDIGYPPSEFFGLDFVKAGVASYTPVWDTFSKTGTLGDPTVATAEKGEKWLDSAAERLVKLIREFKSLVPKKQKTP